METVATYNFESNALYVLERLHSHGINSILTPTESNNRTLYKLKVDTTDFEKAKDLIEKLGVDESDVDPESEGYLESHSEWMNKIYVPGYYTGGKVKHWFYNKDIWKYLAPLYIFGGITLILMLVVFGGSTDYVTVLWIGLYFFVGVSMIWQLSKRKNHK